MAPQEQKAMRRDVHRWFLLGLAFSGILTLTALILAQNNAPVVGTIVGSWVMLGSIVISVRHRRRYASFAREPRLRSREMRCPWARDLRMHFSGASGHASLR
jgi:hypothetical protein